MRDSTEYVRVSLSNGKFHKKFKIFHSFKESKIKDEKNVFVLNYLTKNEDKNNINLSLKHSLMLEI